MAFPAIPGVPGRAGLPAVVPVRVDSPIAIIISGRNVCETRTLRVPVDKKQPSRM